MQPRASLAGLSLKGRALRLLSQREHSRLELSRKLAAHAESPEQLETLLDALEQEKWLSAERFAQSVAHRRGERFGVRRIQQELQAHRLEPGVTTEVLDALSQSERERAFAIWARRFGVLATEPIERARQQRFLLQRGFSGDTITWVLRRARDIPQTES
jgi:regulatory protein